MCSCLNDNAVLVYRLRRWVAGEGGDGPLVQNAMRAVGAEWILEQLLICCVHGEAGRIAG